MEWSIVAVVYLNCSNDIGKGNLRVTEFGAGGMISIFQVLIPP